jgi:eukaryotic-like serine/threonine-protein kinase
LAFGVGVGLLFTMARRIVVVERLRWSWQSGLSTAVFVALCYLLAAAIEGTLPAYRGEALRAALSYGLLAGITGDEIEQRTRPNQGIRRSAGNTLWGLAAGIAAGILVLAAEQQIKQALQTGAVVALLCALRGGLLPCIQHSILRAMLYGSGVTPQRYMHFLDNAVDRIFLRRVGGGYIFSHRLLMEYFARRQQSAESLR